MGSIFVFFTCLLTLSFSMQIAVAAKPNPNPQITVMGMVYCDYCANNSFSKHSYFLPGIYITSKLLCNLVYVFTVIYHFQVLFFWFSFHLFGLLVTGVEVKIDCMFKAITPRTAEQISFSVNRTTNKYGIYKLNVPSVDGVQCARDKAVGNSCRASLISSSNTRCDNPGFRATSDEFTVKSRRTNVCIYSLNALTYRPSERDVDVCGK